MLDLKKFQKMSKELQAGMENMKEELAQKTTDGQAGGGAVSVTVNGNQELNVARTSMNSFQVAWRTFTIHSLIEDSARA